jgi:hypothetical protein
MHEGTQLIADHYQKTYELTLLMWEQRNRTFLLLLGAVGVATLLTFDVGGQARPLLVDFIANTVGVEGDDRDALRTGFPYGVVQSILLMVVLYLIVILYHRTVTILRNYQYLAGLEEEIRRGLARDDLRVSFTREGAFYRENRPTVSRYVAVAYVGMLGLLLAAFLGMRIYTDVREAAWAFAAADVALAVPIVYFFTAYAVASLPKLGTAGASET